MKNKIIWGLIFLAVIFSFFSVLRRYNMENKNNKVELVIDDKFLQEMKSEHNLTDNILPVLKENGITGLSIFTEDIEFLVNEGKLNFIKAEELFRLKQITGDYNSIFKEFSFNQNSAFLITDEEEIKTSIRDNISFWQEKYEDIEYREYEDKLLVYFPLWQEKYKDFPIYNKKRMNEVKNAGLEVIFRLNNNEDFREYNRGLIKKYAPEAVVFSGKEVLGYSSGENTINLTAETMKENMVEYGMIEPFIANQKGRKELAKLLDYNILRVHSLQIEEMEKYSLNKIVDRYVRAVKERNVRLVYLKPFFESRNGEDVLQYNLSYINILKEKLEDNGFYIGNADIYPPFSNFYVFLIIIGAAVIISGLYLLEIITGLNFKIYFWLLFIAGFILLIFFIFLNKQILLSQILALAAAIIFPVLAIYTSLIKKENNKISRSIYFKFIQSVFISLIGALFISAALYHISFLYKVDQFRGVKLSFVMPLFLVSLIYFKKYFDQDRPSDIYNLTVNLLNENIKIKHLLLGFMVLAGGIIYLSRSGNYSLFTVPFIEEKIRIILEEWMGVRPRFKEFAIGHPFLILSLVWKDKIPSFIISYVLLLLATVGQISIINTFSHIHIPLKIDIIRIFNGIVAGIIIALFLFLILNIGKKLILNLNKKVRVKENE